MLLDALTYIIDADNRKLDKALDDSEKKTDGLGKAMTATEKRAKEMTDRATAGFKQLGAAILATVAVGETLRRVTDFARTAQAVGNTAQALGMAVEDVDAFGKAMELMGGDAQGARDSLTDMSEAVGEALAEVDSQRAKTFKALGINLKDTAGNAKTAYEAMADLADAVEGMGREKAVFNIKQLGITDNRTVELILKGRQELERLMRTQKERGTITKESVELSRKYTEAMARFGQGTENAVQAAASVVLPLLTKLLNGLSVVFEWMNKHGDFIKGFFIAIGTVLAVVYGPAVAAAAIATWALIAPFVAVGAAIAAVAVAFALIYDDIVNFMEGNDSLIGQISKDYPAIGEIAKALYNVVSGVFKLLTGDWEGAKESFSATADAIKNVFGAMGDAIVNALDDLFSWFGLGDKAASEMADGMVGTFSKMSDNVVGIFNGLKAAVMAIWEWIEGIYKKTVGMVSGLAEKVGSWFGGSKDAGQANTTAPNPADTLATANTAMATAAANPLNSTTSNAISNSTANQSSETNVSVGPVTVQTQATDAAGISKDMGGALKSELKNMQSEAASGRAR